ncbi:hypothetical protein FNV43_RR09912 [Rhamnella rubrinervis]|uniref:Uncharacterized protein n=1 Tax=Rhamnella rubrinervis TaxID=2594499 RepID=A0A8K0HBL3_9ROSA|nr:hypothetical protein FNV43_RR09912 [Rhamnella rubrinervis]
MDEEHSFLTVIGKSLIPPHLPISGEWAGTSVIGHDTKYCSSPSSLSIPVETWNVGGKSFKDWFRADSNLKTSNPIQQLFLNPESIMAHISHTSAMVIVPYQPSSHVEGSGSVGKSITPPRHQSVTRYSFYKRGDMVKTKRRVIEDDSLLEVQVSETYSNALKGVVVCEKLGDCKALFDK